MVYDPLDADSDEFLPLNILSDAKEFDKVLREASAPEDGLDKLVSKDLESHELAAVGRFARLDVTDIAWTDADMTTEPESFSHLDYKEPAVSNPEFHTLDDSWKFEPHELVRMLIDEFGSLGDQEKLIFEADALIFNDVLVLGVLHLTTHRLTFHASLLSARPDLPSSQQKIMAGSITVHVPNVTRKRRLWLELTHDMLCTYASSSVEDHIRPIRSILLSSIHKITAIDSRKFQLAWRGHMDISRPVEFDTEESAQQWRKEITAAIFLQRHRRREAIEGDFSDTSSGIRLSYPLASITKVKFMDSGDKDMASIQVDENDSQVNGQLFLCPVQNGIPAWLALQDHIDEAKRRRASEPALSDAPVVIDLGPLNFFEEVQSLTPPPADAKEQMLRTVLGLGEESEVWFTRAHISRKITCLGYFVVSTHFLGFWGKLCLKSNDIRYRLPIRLVNAASPINGNFLKAHGLSLQVEGHNDLKFHFQSQSRRDDAIRRINIRRALVGSSSTTPLSSMTTFTSGSWPNTPSGMSTVDAISPLKRTESVAARATKDFPISTILSFPKIINLPQDVLISRPSLHFICLTIGSRGDVQPYIALGIGLKKENHTVTIVTHEEYREWIEGFGLNFKQAGGDPGALMKLSVEHKMFSPEFFKESLSNFREWLDQLLLDAWESCQGADVLLESPSAMAGVHIAEALHIPYFRCFTMPWTKTAEFPHAFLSPPVDSPTFNSASYVLFDNVMWIAMSGQINRWRRHTLKIGSTDMGHLVQSKIVFIYNFSQAVVPKPLDWSDSICISGYWFLDNPDLNWTPPPTLVAWMEKARADGKPIVYIGFGSITVPHPNRVTSRIVDAVLKSGVRAIISKGWSARMSKLDDEKDPEPVIPPECYTLDQVPHDWLFPQVNAALHHGGAGTTGASLRAGIPTLIKPWFGDQFFWASRVQKLGAGLKVSHLHVNELADALTKATTDRIMREKAAAVGERIRSEDGVRAAIRTLYTYLPRASRDRTLLT